MDLEESIFDLNN